MAPLQERWWLRQAAVSSNTSPTTPIEHNGATDSITGEMRFLNQQESVIKGVVRWGQQYNINPELETLAINHAVTQLDSKSIDEATEIGIQLLKIVMKLV